jgi:antitoxin component YwqK of YwqJK toxin-antitoxin module
LEYDQQLREELKAASETAVAPDLVDADETTVQQEPFSEDFVEDGFATTETFAELNDLTRSSFSTARHRKKRKKSANWIFATLLLGTTILILIIIIAISPRPAEEEPIKSSIRSATADQSPVKLPQKVTALKTKQTTQTVAPKPKFRQPSTEDSAELASSQEEELIPKNPNLTIPSLLQQSSNAPANLAGLRNGELEVNLVLPSGAKLTEAMLTVPNDWQSKLFPQKAVVYVAKYPNNQLQGVFSLSNARLHGAAASLYEDGSLQTLAFYKNANLHGPMKQWNSNKRRLLYAEYNSGKKDGLLCFFQDGIPWLLQQCDCGNVINEYLVRWTEQNACRILPVAQLTDAERTEAVKARQQLATMEETMRQNEGKLKQTLAEWYRKEKQRVRQQQFVAGASDRHARQSERIIAHNAEDAAIMESNWRRALRGAIASP